jgi:hypothetical protein
MDFRAVMPAPTNKPKGFTFQEHGFNRSSFIIHHSSFIKQSDKLKFEHSLLLNEKEKTGAFASVCFSFDSYIKQRGLPCQNAGSVCRHKLCRECH